ncbi:hypothetical protein MPSEU_000371300 [Mayamaea pseudoterrestris]|nr:hypothetical protein MPSEU_000371300 [Mayamaea pseudoterrestris]
MDQKPKKRRGPGRPPKHQLLRQPTPSATKRVKPCHDHHIERMRKLEEARVETKLQFYKAKARVLSTAPKHLNDMFGQICFARFGKAYWLALCLQPYDVPPGNVRNQWIEQFERCRRNESLEDMSHIVYWYGAREECSYYGFVAPRDLVTYEEGLDRGLLKPYEAAQLKAADDRKLTKGDQDKLLALKEVNDDLSITSGERRRGVLGFPEVWELLTLDDIDDDTNSSSEEEQRTGKLEDNDDVEDEEDEDDDDDDDEQEPQRYARRKSYHDSYHPSNGANKFVSHCPVICPKPTTMSSKFNAAEQFVSIGPCQMHCNSKAAIVVSQQVAPNEDERWRLSVSNSSGGGMIFANNLAALQHLKVEARKLFNREKEMVLSKLSEVHRNSFGAMGFYKEHTVLVVSPYSVPPGKLRTMWMNTLVEMERTKQLDQLPFLVYQYDARQMGDKADALDHCYALVPPAELVSYEEGERRGLGQIPPEIQRRFLLEGEEALNPEHKHLMNVLREKEMDARIEPLQRCRGYKSFSEAYEMLTLSRSNSACLPMDKSL